MKLDHLGNPVFNEKDLFDALYRGYEIPETIFVDSSTEINQFREFLNVTLHNNFELDQKTFDTQNQLNWFMPLEYKNLDIEGYLVYVCPKEHYQRLIDELQEFKARNMLDLLRWLKYFVDTCRSNSILWGVGRGSSVASYVLYLIGVHKIDPIKYKLDWREFLR